MRPKQKNGNFYAFIPARALSLALKRRANYTITMEGEYF
jgi:hypothetical protein